MKSLFFAAMLFGIGSCGTGADVLTHTGLCDNYPEDSTSPYIVPWLNPSEVSQGNCSSASHFGIERYAYDIVMDIGTTVLAARAGTIIGVEESNADGNGCPSANYVEIEHADGTVAVYAHLTQNGALVNEGASVSQGQAIGLSGQTGCATGPHLHFVVYETSEKLESTPVTFSDVRANPRGLIQGETYP